MKNQLIYLASIALMAGGMAVAQSSSQTGTMDSQTGSSTASAPQTGTHTDSQGDLPAAKEGEAQSGKSSQADTNQPRPGAMGTPETPNAGTSPKGETPATGVQTEQKGSSSGDDSRPGTDPTATPSTDKNEAPKNMSSDSSAPVPSYANPIESATDSATSTPSQQGTH